MILIEDKLFESKILESKYPNCDLEIVYSPDRPGLNYVQVTEELMIKWQKMLEDAYNSNIETNALIKQYEHTIPQNNN
jgi:hypothetical protein